uniref:DNA repair protein RAD50 n=1 Tax=Oryza meridionalis TaxID=40149 RepID=A0A0E0CKU6_9ORYZ
MSTVDKMLIKGIRSFDPENKNVITFFKPLTLIVGPNGAGKTTIIECLKLSCTGELPPNSRSGHTFVHDPKVAGETETKGQIKLRFKTAAGKDVVCIRSFQLTQKASKMEFKAIESVLQTINPHTGEDFLVVNTVPMVAYKDVHYFPCTLYCPCQKVCLSYRCADMDREIPALMGVSKAILENVIFVHQDESNWPLQDPSTLKKKFDDIFSATRYTKALEVIKKLHKDQAQEIKTFRLKLENLQTLKDQAYRLRDNIAQDQEKSDALKIQMEELRTNVQGVEDKIRRTEKSLADLRRLQQEINSSTSARTTYFTLQQQQYAALSEENEDTDDELKEWQTKFEERMALLQNKISKLERDVDDENTTSSFLSKAINDLMRETGRLQAEADAHMSVKHERDSAIRKIFTKHNLGPIPDAPLTDAAAMHLTNITKAKLSNLNDDLQDKKKSNEAQKQFLWGRYLEVNTRYSEVVGQIESKVASKKGISRRMKDKESERDAAEMDLSKYNLPRIDEKERHLQIEVERKALALGERNYDSIVNQKRTEIFSLDQKIKTLQFDEHKDKIRIVFKGRTPSEKEVKKELSQAFGSVDREYNDLNSKSQEAAQELKLVQMKILDARSHLSKLQKELDGQGGGVGNYDDDALSATCDGAAFSAIVPVRCCGGGTGDDDALFTAIGPIGGGAAVLGCSAIFSVVVRIRGCGSAVTPHNSPVGARWGTINSAIAMEDHRVASSPFPSATTAAARDLPAASSSGGCDYAERCSTTGSITCGFNGVGSRRATRAGKGGAAAAAQREQHACQPPGGGTIYTSSSNLSYAKGMRQMYEPFENLARELHMCPCCQRAFTPDEEDEFVKKQRTTCESTAERMNKISLECSNAEDFFQQLNKLNATYEEFVKLGKEAIPLAEKNLKQLLADESEKAQTFDDFVSVLAQVKMDKDAVQVLLQPVETIDRHVQEIQQLGPQVENLEYKLDVRGQGVKSLEQIQLELNSVQRTRDTLNNEVDDLRDQQRTLTDGLTNAQMRWHDIREEKLKASGAVHKFQKAEEDLGHLAEEKEKLTLEEKHLEESLGPLSKERESLLQEHEALKEKLDQEYHQLAERKREFQQEIDALETHNERIKGYLNSKKGEKLNELQEKHTQLQSDLQKSKERKEEKSAELSKNKELLKSQDQLKRNIDDNLNYRRTKAEVERLTHEIELLEDKVLSIGSLSTIEADLKQHSQEKDRLLSEYNRCQGTQSVYQSNISKHKFELKQTQYKDIEKRYFNQLLQLKVDGMNVQTTEMANKDLDRYYAALDKALMRFHTMKMEEINKIIKELWQQTYRGQDIDYISINSDSEGAGTRSYSYRVVMQTGDAELEMRGRCSAGQKVLASLIIRLALAETFCLNCGILALDEPTTNLDGPNAESLAGALLRIMESRKGQENFQLIVITHDERFAQLIGQRQLAEKYYRVSKDEHQHSKIEAQEIFD